MEGAGERAFNLRDAVKWALILIVLAILGAILISRGVLLILLQFGGFQ